MESESSHEESSSNSKVKSSSDYSHDKDDLLMVNEDGDSQREKSFHSRYHFKGKICSIIINGGSYVNVASLRLVKKLNLPTLVSLAFTLGKYSDEILFDVIPMEATHILLVSDVTKHPKGKSVKNKRVEGKKEFITSKRERYNEACLPLGGLSTILTSHWEKLFLRGLPIGLTLKKVEKLNKFVSLLRNDGFKKARVHVLYLHLIPHLDDLLDKLHGFNDFSKIDLQNEYHQICMREGDEWKKTFKTKLVLYEWLVMPFSLANAPSTFVRLMNHMLRSLIGHCTVVYFDDILIYFVCVDDHFMHKFTFYANKVIFLGYVVGSQEVRMDEEKMKVIQNRLLSRCQPQIRCRLSSRTGSISASEDCLHFGRFKHDLNIIQPKGSNPAKGESLRGGLAGAKIIRTNRDPALSEKRKGLKAA
ncbi:Retrovirus-related Pol polyprotein from transposon 17.6, partial [Mucuna pruriens]